MKFPLLSIIIPVYNTEKYVLRCLETIINQSATNYEIIIVNDASTDNSDKIIRSRIMGLENIKYYSLEKNIGVGNARNFGIEHALGTYIGFVDSDDWVDTAFYDVMLQNIISTNTDICISGVKTEYDDVYFSNNRYEYPSNIVIDKYYALHSLADSYNHDLRISPIVNNKIYKRSLIAKNQLSFDNSRKSQDNYFSFMILVYAQNISLVNNVYYHYYQRSESATHNFSKSYIDDYVYILTSLKQALLERNLFMNFEKEYISFVNRCITTLMRRLFSVEQEDSIQKKYILYILKEITQLLPMDQFIENMNIERFKRFWE